MQRKFVARYSCLVDGVEHVLCEVQPCRWCSHRPFYFRINGLVGLLVVLFGVAVQVGRYGQFAHGFEYFGKRHPVVVPCKVYPVVGSASHGSVCLCAVYGGSEHQIVPVDLERASQCALLPLLQVANHAEPRAPLVGLEHQFVVGGLCRFHQEDFYQCPRFLAEVHACLYHPCVVEHHECPFGQIFGQVAEHVFAHFAVLVEQQFAVVALGKRKLGNAFVGQRVVVVRYSYMFCFVYHWFLFYNPASITPLIMQ